MKATSTAIADVLVLEPMVFGDERGFFFESFNQQKFEAVTGVKTRFVQDNHSKSAQGVLRGLHYQVQNSQGKLVRASQGAVFDVAVDIRPQSPYLWQMGGSGTQRRKQAPVMDTAGLGTWLSGALGNCRISLQNH